MERKPEEIKVSIKEVDGETFGRLKVLSSKYTIAGNVKLKTVGAHEQQD